MTQINLKVKKADDFNLIINSLEFECFSDGRRIIGKDNQTWDEVIISNLPFNEYLIDLIREILGGRYDKSHNAICVSYNFDTTYASIADRRKIANDEKKIVEIKDNLKLNILNCYNSQSEFFSNLTEKAD